MPVSLDEFRRWLTGDTVEGLPHRDLEDAADRRRLGDKLHTKISGTRVGKVKFDLTMRSDGRMDAMLKFGRYDGNKVSELCDNPDGRSYLEWMLTQSFGTALDEVVENWLSGLKPMSAPKHRAR